MRFTSVIGETAGVVSYDDHIFLRSMDQETVQVDNHYKVPLPIKLSYVTFPNNKFAAIKKLNSLKRRFIRDKLFHEKYKTLMDEIFQKCYARKGKNEHVRKVQHSKFTSAVGKRLCFCRGISMFYSTCLGKKVPRQLNV